MSKEWVYPENDKDTLWLANAEEQKSFGRILSDIQDHFGSASCLAEFDIEYYRWEYESPCSCCRGSGVYGDFYKVVRRTEQCPDTVNHLLTNLHRF